MIDREWVGFAGLVVFLVLLLLRAPVGLAMVVVGIAGNLALSIVAPFLRFEPYLEGFKTLLFGTVASYTLSVIPLFILMGHLASQAGLSGDLFRGFNAVLGRLRGGVAMAAVGACAGFGSVCGSSLATASTMGRVALPELTRLGYAPRLATGTLAAGGTLGILIPPSTALVLYAIVVEGSVVAMFQAALLPGLLAVLGFIAVIAITVRRRPALVPRAERLDKAKRARDIKRLLPVLVIFAGLIAGLGAGLFTPTPAAAIGATAVLLYGLILRALGRGGLGWGEIKNALLDTAVTTGMIAFIVFGAEVLKGFFARAGLPAALAAWGGEVTVDPYVLLILILAAFIILGCVMESLAMVLVTVPFVWPLLLAVNGGDFVTADAAAFGMTSEELKIWFGIMALVVVELGLITPPVGLNVFIIKGLVPTVPMADIFKGVLPFFGVELVRVALLVALPPLCLLLPRLLSG
ncbi:MAG: TRAP transporter large permease [Devosia sp.]